MRFPDFLWNQQAGSQTVSAQFYKMLCVFNGVDSNDRLYFYLWSRIPAHKGHILRCCAICGEPGGSLDIISTGLGDYSAHLLLLILGQKTSLNDDYLFQSFLYAISHQPGSRPNVPIINSTSSLNIKVSSVQMSLWCPPAFLPRNYQRPWLR